MLGGGGEGAYIYSTVKVRTSEQTGKGETGFMQSFSVVVGIARSVE